MTALLEAKGLCKRYAGFALRDVSFALRPGRIMGLIGKNGAGKSTTLKAVLNMARPDAGSVSMLGEDFFGNERKCKQRVGVVFGGVDFYPLKRLRTITAVTCRFYPNWDQQAYEGYLRRFALDESKPFRTLSEGMKVKYLLALALSHDALIYILDEPTSGLDPVSREEILRIFRRIVRDGRRAVLFSTHITSDLERCADDITYIRDGRVLQSADRETFLRSFDHLKTPGETGNLTLEEIMLRTEGREADEAVL